MGRGWENIRKRSSVGFPWASQTSNVLLEHLRKSSPSSAAEFRPELLCSIPGCLKQLIQVVARNSREKRLFKVSVLLQGSLCLCAPAVGTGHVDSEAPVGVSLCTQLGITLLLQVLSFPCLSPSLGLQM